MRANMETTEHFDELYLDNLDEYIYDENRIVTCSWLSYTLSVHANQAKRMLQTFVQRERDKKAKNLCVTYFVSGVKRNGDYEVQHFQIVPEERLSHIKSTFNPVSSCHVYSVSKSKVRDEATLYQADYDIKKENLMQSNKYSAIVCKQAVLRSDSDMELLREVAQPTTAAPSFSKPQTGSGSSTKKPSGIAGMFASTVNKKTSPALEKHNNTDSQKTPENSTAPEHQKGSQAKGKAGGIANFFANQASKPKKPAMGTVHDNESSKNTTKELPASKRTPPKATQTAKGKKKQRDDSDEEVQQKKRRRIRAQVWSSSSSEDEQEEEPLPEPVREPTPPPTPPSPPKKEPSPEPKKTETSPEKAEPETPSQKSSSNGVKRRKRQKKMVSKSFVDDDGFMVTEKVWETESESCSDEDVIPPTPPVTKTTKHAATVTQAKDKKSPTKKTTPPKKGTKQASLMSFFKIK